MKVVLGGAYGNLGSDVFKELLKQGHEVVALDLAQKDMELNGKYEFHKVDVTKPETLKGLCDGADAVISTIGLTTTKSKLSNYDIDYKGNLNLLNEAKSAGVKHFEFVSVIKADQAGEDIPMFHSKAMFEKELKESGLNYTIVRPTGYFYDIVRQFKPMNDKGEGTLLGKTPVSCNVVSTEDFATFIVEHMLDENKQYNIGGNETYTYDEILDICFKAAGKETKIKRAPIFLMKVIAFISHLKNDGSEGSVRFLIWMQTQDMIGDTKVGDMSFKDYIYSVFKGA